MLPDDAAVDASILGKHTNLEDSAFSTLKCDACQLGVYSKGCDQSKSVFEMPMSNLQAMR
jgi:hypothetical protein